MAPLNPPEEPVAGGKSPGQRVTQREVWEGLDTSSVMTVELLAGILVWGGVGWLLDRWLGTWPWLFAIGVLLGFGAGLYLVWIRSAAAQRRHDEEREQRLEAQRLARQPARAPQPDRQQAPEQAHEKEGPARASE